MKFLPILFLALILSLSIVFAVRYEANNFKEAIISNNGLLLTNTPVYNVSVEGYTCGDTNCSQLTNQIFSVFTENDSIILTYPTSQSAFGYGIYAFKPGYIPYEVLADWYGTDSNILGPYNKYLSKKEICIANLTSITTTQNNSSLSLSATIIAPLNHSGPLTAVPASLNSYYQSLVLTNITINNGTNNQQTIQSITIPFSSTYNLQLNNSLFSGNNTVIISTQVQDSWCINTPIETRTQNVFITINTTSNNQTNSTNQTNQTNNTLSLPIISIINPVPGIYNTTSILLNISTINATNILFNLNNGVNQTYISPVMIVAQNGTNTINAFAINNEGTTSANVTFFVNQSANQTTIFDITPPNSISNLTLVIQTSSTLAWSWINPNNTDFSHVILYLNGINLVNTTNQSHVFNNLNANTQYNLTAYTVDLSGNINTTGITSIVTTLNSSSGSGSSGSSGSSSSGSSSSGSNSGSGFTSGSNTRLTGNNQANTNETLILSSGDKKVKSNSLLFLLGLAIIILLALILLLISRKN